MAETGILSEKELDYLREMMNIGAGCAATALSQMLKCRLNVKTPKVYLTPAKKAPSVLGYRDLPVVCVKMGMVGDIRGEILFVVPESEKALITRLAENANMGAASRGPADNSVLEEVGNIVAGVYLTAIHDFCKLNIYHSVPATAIDAFQSLIDELLSDMSRRADNLLLIENEFALAIETAIAADARQVRTFLIICPAPESTDNMLASIKNAMPA